MQYTTEARRQDHRWQYEHARHPREDDERAEAGLELTAHCLTGHDRHRAAMRAVHEEEARELQEARDDADRDRRAREPDHGAAILHALLHAAEAFLAFTRRSTGPNERA